MLPSGVGIPGGVLWSTGKTPDFASGWGWGGQGERPHDMRRRVPYAGKREISGFVRIGFLRLTFELRDAVRSYRAVSLGACYSPAKAFYELP